MELSFHFHNFLFHIIDAQSSIITHYPVVEIIVVFKISSSTDLSKYKINSGENLVIPTVLHTSRFLFCFVIWRCNLFLRQVKRVEELTVNTTVVYNINTHTDISTPVVFGTHRTTETRSWKSLSLIQLFRRRLLSLVFLILMVHCCVLQIEGCVLLITDILSLLKVIYVNGHHLDLFLRQGKYLM